LAVEGPSKADISCHDNKDGTVSVTYLPTAPGEYRISVKFEDKHIKGSPYNTKVTGSWSPLRKTRTSRIRVNLSASLPIIILASLYRFIYYLTYMKTDIFVFASLYRRGPEKEPDIRGIMQRGIVARQSSGQGLPAVERVDPSPEWSGRTLLLETPGKRKLRYVVFLIRDSRRTLFTLNT